MIPLPSEVVPAEGLQFLENGPFQGPEEIADLLTEVGLPVTGIWLLTGARGEEGYRLHVGADGLTVSGGRLGLKWAAGVRLFRLGRVRSR